MRSRSMSRPRPSDKTYAKQLKGAAILEPIFQRLPRHPGVAHYLIHLYDYPATAEKGLAAAMRYAKIAPAAPHAQHMPSHIYTRVGYWKESIASNIASVKAAKAKKAVGDQLHAQDYLVYAYLQLGQDKKAHAVIDDMRAIRIQSRTSSARIMRWPLHRRVTRWSAATGTARRSSGRAIQVSPCHGDHAFRPRARCGALRQAGCRHRGHRQARRAARQAARRPRTSTGRRSVDIQRQVAGAWVLYAEGKYDEALKAMSAAADAEDKTEKHPVTPGPLTPARELYGAMLLDHGMAKEALAAFEATMAKEPNRFNGFVGAAKAAQALGDQAKAKAIYEKLVAVTAGSDAERPALAAARAFVASN